MAFDQSTSASAAFVYIFAAIIIALTAYGGAQTIRFFNRGDISGRFPLLLLANALAILVFAVFSIIAVATDFDEHAINVLLLSTCAISFTVQLLRAIRLLFTIEVRYFISKQFANQFANQFLLGEGDDMLDDMVDERASYHSEDSEDSNSDNDMDYIEDEDEYDGEDDFYDGDYYETGSLHYSASYHDYLEADKTFGNDVEPSSSSEEEEEEEVLVQQPGQDGDKDALTENSSLFSTQSSVSQDLDDEEDLSNALGRWIFEHKSLASSSFMTGLAVFIYCKFVLLLTLFTMTCGLNWAWILWIVVLTFAVISCALTVASLKMVRIRAYYIWERQKADHDAKYYNKEVSQHEEKQLAEAEEDAAQAKKDAPSKNSSKNSNKDDTFVSATGRSKIASGQAPSGAKSRTGRAESESSRHKGSTMASKAAASKRQNNEKQTQQQAIFNASDSTGAVSIFGTTIVQQTTKDGRAITKDKPQWQKKKAQEKKKPMTSTNANTTTTTTTTPAQHSESSVNKSSQQHSANQLQVQEEVAPENIPALPPAPPTTIFTPTHDPSGQMMELLTCALGTGLLYAVALLLAIIYAAQNEVVAPYTYFVITPTQTSPTFTRGILILLLMSNIIVVYTSLVHIVVNETVRGVITKIIGQQEQDKVDDDITKQFDTLKKILDQPDSRDEFRRFLDGEFSAENLLFWNAIEEYRARPVAHFQSRGDTISSAKYIFSTYLAPGGVYEVNISSQCREKISTRLKGLLEEDPINKVRMMETNEIEDAYDDYCRTQGLYHTYFCTDETGGVRKRDFGNPEEEEEKPKSKRALASAVAHTYCDQINRERQVGDFAKEKPYPVTVFEQYTFVQIGDIYQSISNIIAERMKADGHQHQKRDEPNSKTKPTGGDQDPGADHRRRQVNVVMDKDGPNPPPARLPSIATRHESAPLALTNAKDLDATISMLHKKGPNGAAILTYNKNAKSHAVVQHQQQDHVHESDYSAEDSADDVKIEANELSFTRNANVDDEDDKEREEEDEEEQEEDYADKIQPNWTIYDLIRHKFDQYERYNGKNPNILMYDHGNGQHKPYPPPGEVRRRRRQAKGQDANGNVELNNGNRLHYALMSYEWKVEAARRRLKQYTDIVDELIVVFDAAQLEIFKLMET